jgi:hypothetical protein
VFIITAVQHTPVGGGGGEGVVQGGGGVRYKETVIPTDMGAQSKNIDIN